MASAGAACWALAAGTGPSARTSPQKAVSSGTASDAAPTAAMKRSGRISTQSTPVRWNQRPRLFSTSWITAPVMASSAGEPQSRAPQRERRAT